jgi:hypothetical protein
MLATTMVALLLVGGAASGAFAEEKPAVAVEKTPQGKNTLRSRGHARLACQKEAREHKFGFHFVQRGRFMRACIARRLAA